MIVLLLACLQVQDWVDRLDAEAIEDREEAESRLEALGREAIPALEKALAKGSSEQRARAERILERVRAAVYGRILVLSEGRLELIHPWNLETRTIPGTGGPYVSLHFLPTGRAAILEARAADVEVPGAPITDALPVLATPLRVDLEDPTGRRHTSVRGGRGYSPDGRLYFDSGGASRPAIAFTATGKVSAELHRSFFNVLEAAWSPDGKLIAFTAFARAKEGAELEGATYVVSPEGKDLRRLGDLVSRLTWTPESKELVCLDYEWPKMDPKRVLRVEVATGRTAVVLEGAWADEPARMSPDGKRVAFVRLRNRRFFVCIARADGTGIREVAPGRSVRWSPDGERIAYLDEKRVLTLLPPEGGEAVRLKEVRSFDWVRRRP